MLAQRSRQLELLDRIDGSVAPNELRGNLRDIRRANRYFGGTRAVLSAIGPVLADLAAERSGPIRLLDVATGSADIPVAINRWAERHGVALEIVATDVEPAVLVGAERQVVPDRIVIEQANALALPYADDSFDIVTLSLALHHFEPDDARLALDEMRRVGRHRLIVNDLARSYPGYLGAWLVGHLLTRNRLTRHDAPLSVQRAYKPEEARRLAVAAGWRATTARSVVPFRYLLTGRP